MLKVTVAKVLKFL